MGVFRRRRRIRCIVCVFLAYIATHSLFILMTRPEKLYFVIEMKHHTRHDTPTVPRFQGEKQRDAICCGGHGGDPPTFRAAHNTKAYHRLSAPHGNENASHMYIFSAHFDVDNNVVDILGTGLTLQPFEPVCVLVADADPSFRTFTAGSLQSLHLHTTDKPVYTTLAVHCPLTSTQMAPSFLRLPPSPLSPGAEKIPIQHPTQEYRNFTVCYPAAHSGYSNTEEFVESMAMNSILGAGKAFWYNHSLAPSMRPIVDYFVQCGQLELIPARVPDPVVHGIHYYAQVVVMHDCLYRNRYTSKYILFQDMDEVMVPNKDSNWLALIEKLKNKHPMGGSFALRNAFFTKSKQNGLSTSMKANDVKLLSYFNRHKIYDYYDRSKYFLIPRTVDILQIHGVRHVSDFHHVVVDVADGLLHHYRSDIQEQTFTVDRSLERFSSHLNELIRNTMNCIRRRG